MSKMTDKEITKALEFESTPSEINCVHTECIEAVGFYCGKKRCYAENCMECKEHTMDYNGNRAKAILDLINRQQAEIEKLKKSVEIHKGIAEDWKYEAKKLKEMVGEQG